MKRRAFLAAAAAVGAGAGGLLALRPAPSAPQASFTTFSGETIALASLRGQVVLVYFWASYCAPCRKDMPGLVSAHERFAERGLRTIAVAVSKDDRARARAYAREQRLPFTVAFDDGAAAVAFGNVRVTPSYFLVDREGRLRKTYIGGARWPELVGLLEQALAA